MKFVTDLSKGILGRPDSEELWNEIISYVPDEMLLKPDFRALLVACGHCTEAILLVKRMQSLGIPNSRIQDAIWVLDKYQVFTNQARCLGFKHVITSDFLSWDSKGMKFDLVLGNPPYRKGMWTKFLKNAIGLSTRFVLLITPDPSEIVSDFGDEFRVLLLQNGVQYKKECTAFFSEIKSGKISFYVLDKQTAAVSNILEESSIEASIQNKVLSFGGQHLTAYRGSDTLIVDQASSENGVSSVTKTEVIIQKVKAGKTSRSWAAVITVNRFFGQSEHDPAYLIENAEGMQYSNNVIVIPFKSGTIEGFRSVYLSKLYRMIILKLRNGNMDTQARYINLLPRLDLTRTWTDAELYSHFNLTQEEIDYIEANVA